MNTGLAGELRCVVKKTDGTIVTDTDFQKNMILDSGLNFFGGNYGQDMFEKCLVGSGTTAPSAAETALKTFVAAHTSVDSETTGSEPYFFGDTEHKAWRQKTYRFMGLQGKTVSEVGLASYFKNSSDYYLCTRALIKNAQGTPISITLKADEVLEITYRIWQVFTVTDSRFSISVADDIGGSKPYNAICRLAGVNNPDANYPGKVGLSFDADTQNSSPTFNDFYAYAGDIGDATTSPLLNIGAASNLALSTYQDGDYSITLTLTFGLDDARSPIRSILVPTTMGNFQVQYGSVADDAPIPKSKNDTLTVPIRFTWSRYNGELNVT